MMTLMVVNSSNYSDDINRKEYDVHQAMLKQAPIQISDLGRYANYAQTQQVQ